MEITTQMVKDLRERTGAGVMDAKRALVASDGDMTKAASSTALLTDILHGLRRLG